MAKVIALQGNDNTGKTTTLKLVIKMLLNDKARLIDFSNNFGYWLHNHSSVGDIWAIMEYKNEIIFITTAGDYPQIIKDTFSRALQLSGLKATNINIFISAIHDTPLCKQAIKQIESDIGANQIIYVNKISSQTKTNDVTDANKVFSSI